jgi:hypothetical protein
MWDCSISYREADMQLGNITSFPQVTPVLASNGITPMPSRQQQQAASTQVATAASRSSGAAASAAGVILESAYVTSVGGTKYDASVLQSDDEFVASVPELPLATATGASLSAAESDLTARIDALV